VVTGNEELLELLSLTMAAGILRSALWSSDKSCSWCRLRMASGKRCS